MAKKTASRRRTHKAARRASGRKRTRSAARRTSRGRRAASRKAVSRTRRPAARRTKPARVARKVSKARKTSKTSKASKASKASKPRKLAKKHAAGKPAPRAAAAKARKTSASPVVAPPRLERSRRRLPDDERLDGARDMAGDHMAAAARSGHDDLKAQLKQHTESSPALTAGDVDARWQDAYAVGDETPGGDNPTPDQDRVDDIGRALGVEYQDNQELQGGDEIVERDHKRWELDPASSEDWPHKK